MCTHAGPVTPRAGSRAARLLEMLAEGPLSLARLDDLLPGWRSAAANLKRRGLIEPVRLRPSEELPRNVDGPELTAAQQQAFCLHAAEASAKNLRSGGSAGVPA